MRLRHWTAIAATVALLALGAASSASAYLDESGRGALAAGFIGVKSAYGGREMGTFLVDGNRVVCIETGSPIPKHLSGSSTKYHPLASYVLANYGQTTDDITAAAVWRIINFDAKLQEGNAQSATNGYKGSRHFKQIEAKRQQILGAAKASMPRPRGGYDVGATLSKPMKGVGTLTLHAKDASGAIDSDLQVSISGDASFSKDDASHVSRKLTLNADGTASVPYYTHDKNNSGRVSVVATSTKALATGYYQHFSNGSLQSTALMSTPKPVSFSAAGSVEFPRQPVITTVSSAADGVVVGTPITDQITVTNAVPGSRLVVRSLLYGPLADKPRQQKDAPPGTPHIRTEDLTIVVDANGKGSATTKPYVPEIEGWYTYDTQVGENGLNLAFDAEYGVASETGFVRYYRPRAETVSSAYQGALKVGDEIVDTITVQDARPGSTLTIDSILYGPLSEPPTEALDAPSGAQVTVQERLTVTVDDTGHATATTRPYQVRHAGWYTFDTLIHPGGGNTGQNLNYGVPAESGEVSRYSPKAKTVASHALAAPGTPLFDTVSVTGGRPGEPFRGSSVLYGPFDTDPSRTEADLTKAPIAGRASFQGTYDALGEARTESESVVVSEPGYYVWAETVDADDSHDASLTTTAQASETTVILRPELATHVSDTEVRPGATITDTVVVTGVVDHVGGRPITHTITGRLLGPMPATPHGCEGVDWSKAPIATQIAAFEVTGQEGGTMRVDGVGAYEIPPVGVGCYTYNETLTSRVEGGDELVVTHEPGDPRQTTLVTKPPSLTPPPSPEPTPSVPQTPTPTPPPLPPTEPPAESAPPPVAQPPLEINAGGRGPTLWNGNAAALGAALFVGGAAGMLLTRHQGRRSPR